MLEKLKHYTMLVLFVIGLFLCIFAFDSLARYIGLSERLKSLAWLWITAIVASAYASFTTKKYKKQILKVKFILMSNAIFLATLYSLVLFYLNKIGYNVIPTLAMHIFIHGLVLLYIIFLINEQILKRISRNRTRNISCIDGKTIP